MKILVTGFTPRQVGSTRLLYNYMSNCSVIIKTLRAAGHEVDQRVVDVDEQGLPDRYDVALIGIAVPQSLSSRYWFGAMWAAEQFGPERTRFYMDDWLAHQLQSQFESGLREPEKRFYSLDNRHGYELAKRHTDIWVKWFKFLSRSQYQLLLPCFGWAKPRLLLPRLDNVQPVIFDPTPLALTDPEVFWGSQSSMNLVVPAPMADRRRSWTLAAMRDVKGWFAKQRFDWPVELYGNKRQGQPVLDEEELVRRIYTTTVGVIGAPYEAVKAGGGWRARYVHAAVSGAVLFLDPDEGRCAGKPYDLYRSVVEGATSEQLTGIAEAQAAHLRNNTWSLERLTTELDAYVRGTTA